MLDAYIRQRLKDAFRTESAQRLCHLCVATASLNSLHRGKGDERE